MDYHVNQFKSRRGALKEVRRGKLSGLRLKAVKTNTYRFDDSFNCITVPCWITVFLGKC